VKARVEQAIAFAELERPDPERVMRRELMKMLG
jgi:hypothetical protein